MSRPLRRVVLVDDHDLFRAGVRAGLEKTVEVVGEAGAVADAVPLIKALDPDVVLLDVHLSDRRGRAVLQWIGRGSSYKEIAARLHLSSRTIESHVSAVLRKLQLSNRHDLTRWAAERRLI